jgi:hypothetical protein
MSRVLHEAAAASTRRCLVARGEQLQERAELVEMPLGRHWRFERSKSEGKSESKSESKSKVRVKIKVKVPALANYGLERGTLEFFDDAVGSACRQAKRAEQVQLPHPPPKERAEG